MDGKTKHRTTQSIRGRRNRINRNPKIVEKSTLPRKVCDHVPQHHAIAKPVGSTPCLFSDAVLFDQGTRSRPIQENISTRNMRSDRHVTKHGSARIDRAYTGSRDFHNWAHFTFREKVEPQPMLGQHSGKICDCPECRSGPDARGLPTAFAMNTPFGHCTDGAVDPQEYDPSVCLEALLGMYFCDQQDAIIPNEAITDLADYLLMGLEHLGFPITEIANGTVQLSECQTGIGNVEHRSRISSLDGIAINDGGKQ